MSNINLYIITQNSSFHLELNCQDVEQDTIRERVFYPFIYPHDNKKTAMAIPKYQQNTLELRKRIKSIVEELKSYNHEIYKLYTYFTRNVNENHWFFIADKMKSFKLISKC